MKISTPGGMFHICRFLFSDGTPAPASVAVNPFVVTLFPGRKCGIDSVAAICTHAIQMLNKIFVYSPLAIECAEIDSNIFFILRLSPVCIRSCAYKNLRRHLSEVMLIHCYSDMLYHIKISVQEITENVIVSFNLVSWLVPCKRKIINDYK